MKWTIRDLQELAKETGKRKRFHSIFFFLIASHNSAAFSLALAAARQEDGANWFSPVLPLRLWALQNTGSKHCGLSNVQVLAVLALPQTLVQLQEQSPAPPTPLFYL